MARPRRRGSPRERSSALIARGLLSSGLLAFLCGACHQSVSQPIAFNHRLHIEDVGADCTDCHLSVLTGARATIPNVKVCADCHEGGVTEPPEEALLATFIDEERPIPWQKVTWVPDHVYFSHRRHAAIAAIECETCHGPMREREKPVTRLAVPLTMEACMACHERSGVSNDCIRCHR